MGSINFRGQDLTLISNPRRHGDDDYKVIIADAVDERGKEFEIIWKDDGSDDYIVIRKGRLIHSEENYVF